MKPPHGTLVRKREAAEKALRVCCGPGEREGKRVMRIAAGPDAEGERRRKKRIDRLMEQANPLKVFVYLFIIHPPPHVSMYHYRSRCNTASVYESLQRAEERRTMASSDDGVEIESDEIESDDPLMSSVWLDVKRSRRCTIDGLGAACVFMSCELAVVGGSCSVTNDTNDTSVHSYRCGGGPAPPRSTILQLGEAYPEKKNAIASLTHSRGPSWGPFVPQKRLYLRAAAWLTARMPGGPARQL
eukprot:scaffold3029_cov61-Phaeocystis_antarctica.AAC.2